MLRLRSSGARALDWFCMRGRSVEERAIVILAGAADHRLASYPKDIITVLNRHKARRLMVTAKTNGPDEAGPRRRRYAVEAFTLLPRAVPRAE